MMKTVESLRDQLRISRMPVSICSNELKEYCTQNGNKDPLIHPPERRENPFAEKPKCTILWQCYCDGSYIGEKNFLKKKKTFSQCVIIRNCNSSLLDGNLTIVNRDRKVQEGSRKRARNISPTRCGVLALKKKKKGGISRRHFLVFVPQKVFCVSFFWCKKLWIWSVKRCRIPWNLQIKNLHIGLEIIEKCKVKEAPFHIKETKLF